jgi:hypothetical protein
LNGLGLGPGARIGAFTLRWNRLSLFEGPFVKVSEAPVLPVLGEADRGCLFDETAGTAVVAATTAAAAVTPTTATTVAATTAAATVAATTAAAAVAATTAAATTTAGEAEGSGGDRRSKDVSSVWSAFAWHENHSQSSAHKATGSSDTWGNNWR